MKFDEVYRYLDDNNDRFPAENYSDLFEILIDCDPDAFEEIKKTKLKNPDVYVAVSIFFGLFGIDQILLKNYKRGFTKMITQGGLLFMWIYDIFNIRNDIQNINYAKITSIAFPDLESLNRYIKFK